MKLRNIQDDTRKWWERMNEPWEKWCGGPVSLTTQYYIITRGPVKYKEIDKLIKILEIVKEGFVEEINMPPILEPYWWEKELP